MKTKTILLLTVAFLTGGVFLSEITGTTAWFTQSEKNKGGGGGQQAAAGNQSKTLVICGNIQPIGFDVAQYTDGDSIGSAAPVFNQLVAFKAGATTVEPSLAESWQIAQGGSVYIFHLRRGVKFHTTDYFKPTRDFNADDVVFTFNRLLHPKHPFNVAYPAQFPYFVAMGMDKNLKKVLKIDPYTVKFVLHLPEAAFLQNMAMEFASILSLEYAEQLLRQGKASQINQKPIGTGPFILKRYLRDQEICYAGNKVYWDKRLGGSVKLDYLVFSVIRDSMVSSKKILAGECHTGSVPLNEIEKFKQNPQFVVRERPGFSTAYIAYNAQKAILSKKAARQALDMAIDRESLTKIGRGKFALATNIMPPNQWSYDPSLKNAPYDPIKAKALLKAAGYPKGFNLKLFISLGSDPTNRLIAEMIQSDWKKIGVKVEFVTYEGGEYWRRAANGEHDAIFLLWQGDNGDPDNWLGNVLGCSAEANFAKWCHKPFNDLLIKARYNVNQAERTKLYQAAQKIFKREVPLSPLYYPLATGIYSKKVKFDRKNVYKIVGSAKFTGITVEDK